MSKKLLSILSLLVIASMLLAACQQQTATVEVVNTPVAEATEAPTEAVEPTVAPTEAAEATEAPTEAVEPTVAPTEAPTEAPAGTSRKGGWLDEVVFSVVSDDAAITQIEAGAIDIYGSGLSSADLPSIQDAGLNYSNQNGLFYELTFNPVGPTFPATEKLNPFSSAKVREAMNWLIDRDYINQEVYAGGGLAKFFPITTQFPDYADLADVVRRLESKYAFNVEKATEVIDAEMEAMGATKGDDGKWMFNDEPVTLIFLIRNDSDGTRVPIGDYVSNQLESIGFTVDRQYKTSSEASPLWVGGDPADGLWHIYTGAWSATIIDRDQGDNVQFYYSPSSAYGFTALWQAYTPTEELDKLADDLAYNRFDSVEERRAAFARAMELCLEDSVRVWLIDGKNFAPYATNVAVTYDLAAGIDGAQLWPYTLRFADSEGGQLKWGGPDLFVDPWNPVAGSNWAFDNAPIRATNSGGTMADPYTGLVWPLRIEKAEVTVVEGLPVAKTLDWVSLDFAPSIEVPDDALVDWDAAAGKFITAGEKFTETATAQSKSVVYYPADLFETVKWHDGSNLSMADFMMSMIMTFDTAKEESKIYDESRVSNLESFLSVFKGFRIISEDPLTIEYYSDQYQLDAELNVSTLWPQYGFGEGSWHVIAVGNLAEENGELAYSADKADAAEIEWTSFVGGPSLEILSKYLEQANTDSYIPYPEVLGQYITAEEAAARYANLMAFYEQQGHFWVGTGPYYLDKVYLTEKSLTLKHFADFPDSADRWAGFGTPRIADVEIDGAGIVTAGEEATFDVYVTFEGEAYPQADIEEVKVLLYNATGDVVFVGAAEVVADGQYQVVLDAETTKLLEAGSSKLEIAVLPYVVSVPTFASFEFVAE
ncbi:MAG: ABC transporter substrate-binding protein [Chloroflexota bacterium]